MEILKILHVHNFYIQHGGEDTVFAAEIDLLIDHGHIVIKYTDNNTRIQEMSPFIVALQTIWSQPSYNKISGVLREEKPDLVHFHNTFPLISPAAYYACRERKIPVIQSLDNPRLVCAAATFYRNGKLCQDCLGKTPPLPGVIHRCYHHSRSQTAVIAAMLTFYRWIKTWQNLVDTYLVATEFYKQKFIEAGLPAGKIIVKPHFTQCDSMPESSDQIGKYVLFIGRLDPVKGIRTLLNAWTNLAIPLIIRGDGKLEQESQDFIHFHDINCAEIIQRLTAEELAQLIKNARFLIWPSEGYYETFGMIAIECFAQGIPVIGSNIGVISEIVKNGETGLLFNPGDPIDLAKKVSWLWNHPEESARMGHNARKEYEDKYTPERNYQMLIGIYEKTMAGRK
ncbi:MAG: glycosyltransferase family 4 protein [Anaerolineales bacterium]|jgi:glycosyltransferase involved in cell wall biosynthesis